MRVREHLGVHGLAGSSWESQIILISPKRLETSPLKVVSFYKDFFVAEQVNVDSVRMLSGDDADS